MRFTSKKVYIYADDTTKFVYGVYACPLEEGEIPANHTQYYERYERRLSWMITNVIRNDFEYYTFHSEKS